MGRITAGGRGRMFPWLVLAASLGLTFFATYYAVRTVRLQNRALFQSAVDQRQSVLDARMEAYVALLRAGAAFLSGTQDLTRQEFRAFVERLRLSQYYPGVQGFGFSVRVPRERKAAFEAQLRQQGITNHIWPEYPREEYHSIIYLEPLDDRNQAAIGYDMFSEPTRRAAMTQARDQGKAVASGIVELVQEIESPKQAGFLIYVPTYAGGEVPASMEERREKLTGFVYSAFRAGDLFNNLYGGEPLGLQMEVFDAEEFTQDHLMFDSHVEPPEPGGFLKESLTTISSFHFAGRTWYIQWRARPDFYVNSFAPFGVMTGGVLLSLLLFYLTRAQAQARLDAEETAARLRESERSLLDARAQLQAYATDLEQRVTERTSRLQESLQALEGVLYHVAHDLRAPLRAMASFTHILAEEYAISIDPRGRNYLQRVFQASRRMDDLVKDLLAYGRLAHMPVPTCEVGLEEQVIGALHRLDEPVRQTRASIRVERPLPKVRANPGVLREVVIQLLANALKFVAPGTIPSVRVWATDGAYVRLWIEDNGIGIQPEYQDRVFRVFERLHTGDEYSGTGIGLAIVQKAMERMGGKVGLESQPGKGSRFWIELPAVGPASKV